MGGDALKQLQNWFSSQCDGDWEHNFGFTIETIDNPGWSLEVDLNNTEFDGEAEFFITEEKNDNDWYMTGVRNNKFFSSGDPSKLGFIINEFLEFIKRTEHSEPC